mgnify:CR=1 FL=1
MADPPGVTLPSGRPALLASDLDGTLLREDGSISARTRAAIHAAQEVGIGVLFVTARPPRWLASVADAVGGHGTVIAGNGAWVYDVHGRRVTQERGFDRTQVLGLVRRLRRALPDVGFAAERASGPHIEAVFHARHPESDPAGAVAGPIEGLSGETVGKLLATAPGLSDDELLARVCRMALDAHEFTGGLFNPMVLPALAQAGYSTTFDEVSGGNPVAQSVPDPANALTLAGNVVQLREGALDLGGIVKGWTVDIGIESLSDRHPNLFLNAGGDLRCAGAEEGVDGWFVAVAAHGDAETPWEGPMRGALATSTTRKRRWTTASGEPAHHLIDPRTGLPAASAFDHVSVWHAETWVAECWAKAVLIGGEAAAKVAAGHVDRVLAIESGGAVRWW